MRQDSSQLNASSRASEEPISPLKKYLLFAFHGIVAVTYVIAIIVINLARGRPYDPVLGPYGPWRFLTYNCLVLQFITYNVFAVSHFSPATLKVRDCLYTVLALPISMFVVITFWSVWFIAGRENILPVEANCPDWLNHVCHTMILPVNLIQMILMKHKFLPDKEALLSLFGYLMIYNSYLLFIRFRTGKFVYVFMNKLTGFQVTLFILAMIAASLLFYKLGKFLHQLKHGDDDKQLGDREIVVRVDYKPSRNGTGHDGSNGLTLSIE